MLINKAQIIILYLDSLTSGIKYELELIDTLGFSRKTVLIQGKGLLGFENVMQHWDHRIPVSRRLRRKLKQMLMDVERVNADPVQSGIIDSPNLKASLQHKIS